MEILKTLPDNSVDSVVTDPPYGLGDEPDIVEVMRDWVDHGYHEVKSKKGFMGKEWDAFVPQPVIWREVFRVLKPGGHALVACGTRTQDWMTASMRFAGFEIRDVIAWVYGSGFPKSLDISKAIDKAEGHWRGKSPGVSTKNAAMSGANYLRVEKGDPITAAAAWDGWGTALKPAMELWTLARKPLGENTVAANVLKHGTGGLNIDGCRVETTDVIPETSNQNIKGAAFKSDNSDKDRDTTYKQNPAGRFPANFIHDGSDEVLGLFPQNAGAAAPVKSGHNGNSKGIYGDFAQKGDDGASFYGDKGSAARFFYCAKASKSERGEYNKHPTVKPVALMRYLIRLITPDWGTVLDPYAGSGTTGVACVLEDMNAILIEREPEYIPIIEKRIDDAA